MRKNMKHEEDYYMVYTPNCIRGFTGFELNNRKLMDALNKPADPKNRAKLRELLDKELGKFLTDDSKSAITKE